MMRKPLGRGLDALIGGNAAAGSETGAAIESGDSQFKMAPVGSIAAGAFQPRINFDKERLAELTRAIQSQGIIEPLIVRRIAAPGRLDRAGHARVEVALPVTPRGAPSMTPVLAAG